MIDIQEIACALAIMALLALIVWLIHDWWLSRDRGSE